MNDSGETLLSSLSLSVAILAPSGMPARTALRLGMLTRAAARFLPLLAAHELASNMLQALEFGALSFLEVFESAVAARQIPREGGAWLWPRDVDSAAVFGAMHEAWRQVTV